jgi:hypothetical protein
LSTTSESHNERAAPPPTATALFALVWESLVDMLGSASAATLVRRAAKCAAPRCPELLELTVVREQLEYRCILPAQWNDVEATEGLRQFFIELCVLLVDLTGPVVVDRLRTTPALEQSGFFAMESVP